MSREIITLQLGNYANYVGTHWWNIQESGFSYDPNAPATDIDHDTLFREGTNARGDVTYTPRLLLVDLKGALMHLSLNGGELYAEPTPLDVAALAEGAAEHSDAAAALCWDETRLDVVQTDPCAKPKYQKHLQQGTQELPSEDFNFSESVATWTDYMYSRYHPRSINVIGTLNHSAKEAALDTFATGQTLWKTAQFQDDFADRIRNYIEECNHCQGFQLLFDGEDGFGGLAAATLQHLNDEYNKTSMCVPVFAPNPRTFAQADATLTDTIRVVNVAMSYASLVEDQAAALIVPLSTAAKVWRRSAGSRALPLFAYRPDNLYETSAVLATYLDTITLEYRRKSGANSVASFCSSLNNYGRRLAATGIAMPFQLKTDEYLINCLDSLELDSLFTQLSPNTKVGTDKLVQYVSVRGVPESKLKKPLNEAGQQIRMSAYSCATTAEMLQLYFQCNMYGSLTHVSSAESGMPLRTPFPMELFDDRVRTKNGFYDDFPAATEVATMAQAPIIAAIQTSCDLANTIETLHREAARVKVAKIPRFIEAGLEADDFAEALERLLEFADNYDDAFEL